MQNNGNKIHGLQEPDLEWVKLVSEVGLRGNYKLQLVSWVTSGWVRVLNVYGTLLCDVLKESKTPF